MKFSEFFNPKTGEYFQAFDSGDFEYEKPIEHYKNDFIVYKMIDGGIPIDELSGEKEPSIKGLETFKQALIAWDNLYKAMTSNPISASWVILLTKPDLKKKDQINLLKEEMLSPESLLSLYAEAEKEGYTLSQYTSELLPNGTDEYSLPIAIHKKDDGGIEIIGKSGLTDGQLKEIVENRKCLIANFLDKGEKWHCLITTYDSLKGKEKWNNNQPHFHYISSNFGISREEVVSQIKSGKYKLNNLPHIQLEGYGKQPK